MNKFMTTLVSVASMISLVGLVQGTAIAQRGGAGGGGGFGGAFGGQRGGAGQMGLSNLPVDVLVKGLKLTAEQKTKVEDVQKKIRDGQRAAFGGGNNPFGGGGGGGRLDPEQLKEMMAKMQEDRKKNDASVEAILTDDQKKALPVLLKEIAVFQGAQLPLALISDLKLTEDQKTKISDVVKQIQKVSGEKRQEAMENQDFQALREIMTQTQTATKEKTRALLTTEQKAMVEKYEKDNPNQGFGGRGGRGGAPGGGAPGGGQGGGRGGRGGNPPPTGIPPFQN